MKLTDNKILLRPFKDSDLKSLTSLFNNKAVWDNLRDCIPFPYTESDANDFIKTCKAENPQLTFAIEYKGQFVGSIGLVKQTDIHRLSAELGYWVGEPFWGNGIAKSAVRLITQYGFSQLGLIRIYSGVFASNTASQKVLEKVGFKLEGVFENSIIKNERICSEYRFACFIQ